MEIFYDRFIIKSDLANFLYYQCSWGWFLVWVCFFLCGRPSNSCLLKLPFESTFHPSSSSIACIPKYRSPLAPHQKIPNLWSWGIETNTFSEILCLPVVKGSVAMSITKHPCKNWTNWDPRAFQILRRNWKRKLLTSKCTWHKEY